MVKIVSFLPKHFDGMVDCYRQGFPNGHNRYTLARLARFQRDTIFLAVDQGGSVVGVLIGITSVREAWFTALTLAPGVLKPQQCIAKLAKALSHRFIELGFSEAQLTTKRRSILRLVEQVKAPKIIEMPNCYFDGQTRWIVTVNKSNLPLLMRFIT